MRKSLEDFFAEEGRPETYKAYRIPVAPRGNNLYLLEETGKEVCADNVPNCAEAVFDETLKGVTVISDWSGVGILVVRRPDLQMPDIATIEQLGHVSDYTVVYRFTRGEWKHYLCKETPIGTDAVDPHPEWVAYQTCTQDH